MDDFFLQQKATIAKKKYLIIESPWGLRFKNFKSHMKNVFFLGLMLLTLASCSKDDDVDYGPIDEQKILDYLEANNKTATKDPSGLYYDITQAGTGKSYYPGAIVTVRYTGKFLNGEVFESNKTRGPLSNYIAAWQIGIPKLKENGEAILYCPSSLAYGSKGGGSIPPNTPLIFEVKLILIE